MDHITDPAGRDLDYGYDPQGRLTSFANRELNLTQFQYELSSDPSHSHFHYLTRIVNPRGVSALRTEFDEAGRMVKQIDADGQETVFDRGINVTGRFEKVTDRLGHATTFYYDDRGNVTTKIDALGGITTYTYDANDNQLSMTDPLGRTSTMTYDSRKNVLSQTDARGKTTVTAYNGFSSPTQITDPEGRVQAFTYDPANNNLLTHTVGAGTPLAATTTFTYDSSGRLTQTKDALNQTTTHAYGADGRIASTTNALGHTTSWTYDLNGNRLTQTTTRTQANGVTVSETTDYVYDSENRMTLTVFPDETFVETTYNAFGKTASTKDQLGRATVFTYDDRGNLTQTDHPDGTFELTSYDLENRVVATSDRNGNPTVMAYDALGRTTRATAADGTFTQTAYDAAGQVTSTTDARGNVTTFGYDAAGRRTTVTDALSQTTTYAFDDAGNQTGFTDALGRATGYTYDARGQRTTVTFHDGTTQTTTFDTLGRKVAETDQEGKITRYRHDALGRLVEVRQYTDQSLAASDANFGLATSSSGVVSTRYSYDELGNQTTQTDALDRITRYGYDSLGRRVKRTLPDGAFETYTYNAVGNLTTRTDFAGKTTTFAYDAQNRLITKTADPSHPSLIYSHAIARVEYDYDDNGARAAARTYSAGNSLLYSETTSRDTLGRVTLKTTPLGALGYSYHANGLLKDVASSNANGVNTAYRYDALNRLAFVDDASGAAFVGTSARTTAYSYNAVGSLATVTAANGVRHGYAYDPLNRLTALSVSDLGSQVLRSYGYTLNPSGHRSQISESTGRTANYTYDGIYRLTNETISGDASGNGSIGYTLDKVGNRLARASSVAPVSSASHSFNTRDWLTSDAYDANGNTLTSAFSAVSVPDVYDFEDRLIIRRKADGSTVNLAYDADGILRQKTILSASATLVGATGYLVDTNNLTGYAQVVEEFVNAAGGVTERVYTYGADLISQATLAPGATASTHRFYAYDGMGSVRALTDANGAITDTWDYDAFGVLIRRTGLTENDYQYRGERFDSDLGMYSLRARFYNQDTGRFWNADTYEGSAGDPASLHKYLYAHANPVTFHDPTGQMSLSSLMATGSVLLKLYSLATVTLTTVQIAVDVVVFRAIYQPLLDALKLGMLDAQGVLHAREQLIFEKHYNKVYEKALTFIMKTLVKSAVIIKPVVAAAVIGITALAVDGFQWQHLIPIVGTYLQIRDFVAYSKVIHADLALLGVSVVPPSENMGLTEALSYARGTASLIAHTYEEIVRRRSGIQ